MTGPSTPISGSLDVIYFPDEFHDPINENNIETNPEEINSGDNIDDLIIG